MLFWPPISQRGSHNIRVSMSVGSLSSSHCATFSEMARRLMKENPPDSATSSSGPSPPPAAAGASGSQTTGSLAPGSKVCEQSSSDVKPCCFWWLQMISRSLPLLLVCPHAESRLRWEGSPELQKYRCHKIRPKNSQSGRPLSGDEMRKTKD